MILNVLGSSSKGNGYVLQSSKGDCLVLEAGVPFLDVLRACDYSRSNIVACCVSHRHTDHAKYYHDYIKAGVKVFGSTEMESFLPEAQQSHIGDFTIIPFSVHHDVPNYGYLIRHKEMGWMLFATDCQHIPKRFRACNHYLIEANYSADSLLLSDTDAAQKRRIMESHQSFEDCMDYLHACVTEDTQNIILVHLSSRHSDAQRFTDTVQGAFAIPCHIARKGFTLNL